MPAPPALTIAKDASVRPRYIAAHRAISGGGAGAVRGVVEAQAGESAEVPMAALS
jgi:hypothetical protein